MSEPTLDDRAAAALGMHPEQVAIFRNEWEKSPASNVIRCLLSLKIEDATKEKMNKLRKCAPEELSGLQGALDALDLAATVITTRIVG